MPSVVLPILAKDNIGAAYIPRASRMHAGNSDLLIVVNTDTGVRPVEAALKEYNVPILNMIKTDVATAFVVRPPDDLRATDLWSRMGVSASNLGERDRTVDLDDHVVLMRRFRDCLNGAGLAAMETPRRIGMNLAGSVVYETIGGRVAVNMENQPHYEYDRLPDGREKGVYRDRFLRAISPVDLRGCAEGNHRRCRGFGGVAGLGSCASSGAARAAASSCAISSADQTPRRSMISTMATLAVSPHANNSSVVRR